MSLRAGSPEARVPRMSNAIYPKAREGFLKADIDWLVDDIRLVAVTSAYVYDAAHDFLNDVSGGYRVATSGSLTGKDATLGIADADDVTLASVTGSDIEALILYKHTGTESTSPLILFLDTKTNASAIVITPVGDDVIITWSNGSNKIFKL